MIVPAHGSSRHWRWPGLAAIALLLVGAVSACGAGAPASSDAPATTSGATTAPAVGPTTTTRPAAPLDVRSTSPSSGDRHVASNATVTVRFSTPVSLGVTRPTFSPAVTGTWRQSGARALRFTPTEAMVPYTRETVTVPGGRGGLRGTDGATLADAVRVRFTVADGSTLRLQQLLAKLGYLPLRFTATRPGRPHRDDALSQNGSFTWRWAGTPSELTSQWTGGYANVITKGAVMAFEERNGLNVDGLAGPAVWKALLHNFGTDEVDGAPYTYVLVTKTLPEHLELWEDGAVKFADIAVNTGAPGADTTDGTYPVFEHVKASDMAGTNPDGSTYDDKNVPWASFFLHGDALHGFVRATYGSPQSNGCVEMPVATAGQVWPYTPIGTLVTVTGPPVT